MSVIQEMRDVAASLPDGPVKKMLVWAELELGERAERIFELEQEIKDEGDARIALEKTLHQTKIVLESVNEAIISALFRPHPPAKDLAPFTNVMAAHGIAPYAKKIKKGQAMNVSIK